MESVNHRMKVLIEQLNAASKAYYQEDKEIMSNFEYDQLYDELVSLEAETGLQFAHSPTNKVGYEILSNLVKIPHERRMLSLDKTKEVDKLRQFLDKQTGILSWKLDGLTIVLTYEGGKLKQGITRGNGEIGEDVTHNVKVFQNVPLNIEYQGKLTVRGEAIIGYGDFERINEEIEEGEKYKNPRNLCSGTVRQLNSEIAAKRRVRFIAFSLVDAVDVDFQDRKWNEMEWLTQQGFEVVEHRLVMADDVAETVEHFASRMEGNDYASDGLVLTLDSISYSESLGVTSKFPRDSIAFKWADEVKETQLVEVQWSTSRTGLINPIALFEPVELEGTTVNKASLHNVSVVESLALGIGDTIRVYKANMIIPQVLENCTRSNTLSIPDQCPVCHEKAVVLQDLEAKVLKCENANCQAQQIRFLAHFVSRDAMNIEGLSEATLEKFVQRGFLRHYPDIFVLAQYEEEIKKMEGFGERSYNKLIQSIEKAKTVQLPNFIYALGIPQVGLSNAKLLCRHYQYDVNQMVAADAAALVGIDGFGEKIAASIEAYFANEENRKHFYDVLALLDVQIPSQDASIQLLQGKTFVITGSLERFTNRKELETVIEQLGGKVTGSVTAKTHYLINNDAESNSSKNKKARELGIPILKETEFIEQFYTSAN